MSAIVDLIYYQTVYMGNEADQESFPALYAHAPVHFFSEAIVQRIDGP